MEWEAWLQEEGLQEEGVQEEAGSQEVTRQCTTAQSAPLQDTALLNSRDIYACTLMRNHMPVVLVTIPPSGSVI